LMLEVLRYSNFTGHRDVAIILGRVGVLGLPADSWLQHSIADS
jgi:hypothetical protein